MLKWVEGFEAFGSSGDPVGMDAVYTVQTISSFSIVSGRIGGSAIEADTGGGSRAFRTPAVVSGSTIVVGFAFYATMASATRDLLNLYDGNGSLGINLRLMSTNEFEVRRGTTQLGTTTGQASGIGSWHYIELKVVCADSPSGSYTLKIDGVSVLSGSGIDTKAGSSSIHASAELCAAATGCRFDDWYIDDANFRGDKRVVTIFPDAAGDSAQFTPSAGNNYQAVDEVSPDGDSTYVESSTTGHRDLHNFPTPSGLGTIDGICHRIICRKTDVTDFDVKLVSKTGSTTDVGSAQSVGSTSFLCKQEIAEVSPDTSSAWTA